MNIYRWLKNIYKYIPQKKAVLSIEISRNSEINFLKNSFVKKAVINECVQIGSFSGLLENLTVGRNTFIGSNLHVIGLNGDLVIGKFCSIAGNLLILCGEGYHINKRISTYPFPFKLPFKKKFSIKDFYDEFCLPKSKVVIGNDVWIGQDVLITNGINIGNGAVIAAKSVVTHNVPAYSVVAGNPAKVVKKRFDDGFINLLEKISWWDWSIEKIEANYKIFTLTDEELLEELDNLES
tara:strand:+ start:132 stop:842 length:711 start_codon:yes stop_codon:yes gene_type:complete